MPPGIETPAMPWEKGGILLGGNVAFFNSDVVFGIEDGGSQSLNAEDLLGLDTSMTVFRAGAFYRPGASRRHQIDVSYAGYHRDGSATTARDVTIDGVTYPAGSRLETVFNFDVINATYSYAFWQTERMRIAVGLGIYAVPLKVELDINTTAQNPDEERISTTLPLPALAVRGEFRLVDKLFLTTSLEGMYLEVSDFKGSMADINAALEYRAWKYVGFGLGYNFMGVHVEGERSNSHYPGSDFVGQVDVQFSGLFLYGKASF
jgi:hypothetical protein